MISSRWQLNRIGLVDFWYYDEEEFSLLDGRMLLRGANGSGKSVTMQSFIPVLLDGNIRPERLDPFGSRARKMENYLLEEGDKREERTGYLYMEFKRSSGNNYLTIGMGLKARKNKKLDTWYFFINDGRRIGKDFFLYRSPTNKITYTKQELKNRIGEGGRILESQTEYMGCINQLLFGFDTLDQYKELLELLIQLRSPKLSKEFRPTVINEILSNSLQTLSEDDLRPVSESIENMDALKNNLEALKESMQGAKQIEKAYEQYNKIVLFNKSNWYLKELKQWRQSEQKAKEYDNYIFTYEEKYKVQKERYTQLYQEEELLKQEKNSLENSDAAILKEREITLQKDQKDLQDQKKNKENQRYEKEEKRRETEHKLQEQQDRKKSSWKEILDHLNQLKELIANIPFDEFLFLEKELEETPTHIHDFKSHEQLLSSYTDKVTEGIKLLTKENQLQEKYDEQLKELDQLREERSHKEKECKQYETLLLEIKSELIEKLYIWNNSNKEFLLLADDLQEISRMIDNYSEGEDYADIKEVARKRFYYYQEELHKKIQEEKVKLQSIKLAADEKQKELEIWIQKEEPEPERTIQVQRNRTCLLEKKIPFQPFYQVIEFDDFLDIEQASHLEEAFLSMGILDALIIPKQYRSQVLNLDKGMCDRYIFANVEYVKNNIQKLFTINNAEDPALCQTISNVLSGIGYMEGNTSTWIDKNGSYKIGIIEGTISGEYESKFIGVRAREQYRQQQIAKLQMEYEEIEKTKKEIESVIEHFNMAYQQLDKEWINFPDGIDLKTAVKSYSTAQNALEYIIVQITNIQQNLEKTDRQLTELKLEVREICAYTKLPARLHIFEETIQNLMNYRTGLQEIQLLYISYANICTQIISLEENIENLDKDLDDILYDLSNLGKKIRKIEQELLSIENQMKLTDYNQIKERLDYCIKRLNKIPLEREDAVKQTSLLEEKTKQLSREKIENEENQVHLLKRIKYLEEGFLQEYLLGYVEQNSETSEYRESHIEKLANHIYQMLSSTFGTKNQNDLLANLQQTYHECRGYLTEYTLTLENIFPDNKELSILQLPTMKRLDIIGKYHGVTTKFRELIQKLTEDIEQKSSLLSEKDRELFEDILANTINNRIRSRIHESNRWVGKMNHLMNQMKTSSGLKLNLKWKSKHAEQEEQLDTKDLVSLLKKDVEIMRKEEIELLSKHFRSKIEEARKLSNTKDNAMSFHAIVKEVLDYRKWFEFQLEYQKIGENKKELTDRAFYTFSGGEKAMSMYVPLFSAVAAKYKGANEEAPRLISLDEAFAGVDETNIKDMFRLLVDCEFNFIINSQILWGDYETVPAIAVYQLLRPENAKYITVIPYIWNGKERNLADNSEN